MGLPTKLFSLYYDGWERKISADAPAERIEILKQQLAMPHNVDYFTAHLGFAYIHEDIDVEKVLPELKHSIISHPRSCKRALNIVIHPSKYQEIRERLLDEFSTLKVDHASNLEADITTVSDSYWKNTVGKSSSILEKGGYGKIIYGQDNKFHPKLIEMDHDGLNKGGFARYASRETMYPYANLYQGDAKFARDLGGLIASQQPDGLALTTAIFTNQELVYNYLRKAYFAYDNNQNIGSTRGLGGKSIDGNYKFVRHQGIALEQNLLSFDS